MMSRGIATALTVAGIAIGLYVYLAKTNPMLEPRMSGCEQVDSQVVLQHVGAVNDDIDRYTSSSRDLIGESSEGGQQITYSQGGDVVLVRQTFYGETGRSEASYYLNDGRVYYFTKTNLAYKSPLQIDPTGKVEHLEKKDFYFDNQQNLCFWYKNDMIQQVDQDTRQLVNYLISGLR